MRSLPEFLAAMLLLTSACAKPEVSPDGAPAISPTPVPTSVIAGRDCPGDPLVTYQSFGSPFMSTWCTGCHSSQLTSAQREGAPVGVDFDTLDGVRSNLARIYARAADTNVTMPPVGEPGSPERTRLGDWIACGAP